MIYFVPVNKIIMLERQDNHIYAYGTIGYTYTGDEFAAELRAAMVAGDPVVHLHTNGGSVSDGLLMANTVKAAWRPVTTIVEGMSASMGVFFMLASTKIQCADNAMIMVHAPSTWFDGGNLQQLRQEEAKLAVCDEVLRNILATRGIPSQIIEAWFDGADHWFTAAEAKDAGLVDELVGAVVSLDAAKPKEKDEAAALDRRFCAVLDSHISIHDNINMKNLLKKLGLAETATEQEAIEAVAALQTAAAERDTLRNNQIAEILSTALSEGRITAEVKPTYESIGKTMGVDTLRQTIAALPTRKSASSLIEPQGNGAHKKFDDYTKEELLRMRTEDRARYDALLDAKYKE